MDNNYSVAPNVDEMIFPFKEHPRIDNPEYQKQILDLFDIVKKIEPQGEDELRRFWIKVERGTIEDFGTFEEFLEYGEGENQQDFFDLWKFYYPEELKWYLVTFISHGGQYFVDIDNDTIFEITDHEIHASSSEDPSKLIGFLKNMINSIVENLGSDEMDFNSMIEKELPHSKRFGRILRSDYWELFPELKEILRDGLTEDDLKDLVIITELSKKRFPDELMEKMTARDFFEYCKMGYEANDYLKKSMEKMELKDIYLAFADGRDCGLCDIDPDSEEEFLDWYLHRSHCGGHPWEISRGGNTTHISMYVCREDNGWFLNLAGSSLIRTLETVKMALVLFRNKIPIILHEADQIMRMVKGIDYIGIVPDIMIPRYCGSCFPEEDEINYFMNLGFEKTKEIIERSYWYPLEPISLRKGDE
jgi:hypothetical protein